MQNSLNQSSEPLSACMGCVMSRIWEASCIPPQMLSRSSPWPLLEPEIGSCRPWGPPRRTAGCTSSMQWPHLPLKAFGVQLRACGRNTGILEGRRFSQLRHKGQVRCLYGYTPPRSAPFSANSNAGPHESALQLSEYTALHALRVPSCEISSAFGYSEKSSQTALTAGGPLSKLSKNDDRWLEQVCRAHESDDKGEPPVSSTYSVRAKSSPAGGGDACK